MKTARTPRTIQFQAAPVDIQAGDQSTPKFSMTACRGAIKMKNAA